MSKKRPIRTVRDLVLLWGESPQAAYTQLAADMGAEYREHMPRDWARRNRIPVEHIDPLVNAAQRRGFHDITHAFVVKMIREGVAA